MYELIAPTLFQNKICRLPGIGTLVIVTHPAKTDRVNFQLHPPVDTIALIPEDKSGKGFNEFSAISELLQKQLDETGSFLLDGVGTLTKDTEGGIQLAPVPLNPVFAQAVPMQIATRPDASHPILVGDQQTDNLQMTEYFSEKEPVKDRWRVWAILLAAVATGLLVFYFFQHGFNGLGNISY